VELRHESAVRVPLDARGKGDAGSHVTPLLTPSLYKGSGRTSRHPIQNADTFPSTVGLNPCRPTLYAVARRLTRRRRPRPYRVWAL